MSRDEVIAQYFRDLGRKRAEKRFRNKTKEEVSEEMRQLVLKRWAKKKRAI